jgi:predicted dehydrogenase
MSSLSRRGFLHTSVGAAAAVTASAAFGAQDQEKTPEKKKSSKKSSKAKAAAPGDETPKTDADTLLQPAEDEKQILTDFPKDKLRVCVMGCGGRGGSHVDAFAGTKGDTVVVALCDPDTRHLESFVKKVKERQPNMPEPKAEQDIRKLLEDKDIDAVSIATCNHWHSLGAIWAIQAGKDVYVEKPCSHNVSEGRRLVEFARRHNKIVQHGTQSRSDGSIRAAIQFIRDGGIGKLQLARALCYKRRPTIGDVTEPQPIPPEVDYNLWLGPAPEKPLERKNLHYDWHYFWDYGNGDLGNQGVHQMDIAAWGIGAKELPRAVHSAGGRLGYVDDGQTPNTLMCLYDYGDAGKLLFEVRGLETDKVLGVGVGNIFYGTEGYVVMGAEGGVAAYTPDGEKIQGFKGQGEDHFQNFVKAVKTRQIEDLSADIEKGHISAALCHLGNISYRTGSPQPLGKSDDLVLLDGNEAVSQTWHRTKRHLANNGVDLDKAEYVMGRKLTIDPRAEMFTGEGAQEANRLLSRAYRKPFVVPDKIA